MTAAADGETAATAASLQALRDATGREGGPMERHSLRVFELAVAQAEARGLVVDRELLLCAALLHDIGIYPRMERGGSYVSDGREFAQELLAPFGWAADRLERCLDAIEYHHLAWPQWRRGVEVELIRRADLIELSSGLVRFGLPRAAVKAIFRKISRRGVYPEIARRLARVIARHPLATARIFAAPTHAS